MGLLESLYASCVCAGTSEALDQIFIVSMLHYRRRKFVAELSYAVSKEDCWATGVTRHPGTIALRRDSDSASDSVWGPKTNLLE